MRSISRLRSLTFLLSTGLATFAPLLTACGGGDEATPPPVTPTVPAPPPAPAIDLSAVPEPAGIVLSGRIAHPDAAVKEVGVWTGMPMPGGEQIGEMVVGAETGRLLDLSKSIDFVMTLAQGPGGHPRPSFAVSLAISSLDEAKAALGQTHKLVPAPNGVFVIRPQAANAKANAVGKAGGDDDDSDDSADDDDTNNCSLTPAFGAASARMICGQDERSVTLLLPYLARTMPRATYDHDVHLDIRPAPLKPVLDMGKGLLPIILAGAGNLGTAQQPITDLLNAFLGDATDFTADAKQLTLDMNLTDSGLDVHGVTKLQSAKSVAAELLLAHPDRNDSPPPEYFKLPGDSDIAAFSRGSDPTVWKHPLQLAGDTIAAVLQGGGLTEADAKGMEQALVDAFTPTDGMTLSAHGIDSALVTKASDAYAKVASGDEAKKKEPLRQLVEARTGWWVISHAEDAAAMNGRMKELMTAWNKPGIAKAWKAKLPMLAIPKLHAGGAVPGAPAGTQHYVLELTPMAEDVRTIGHGGGSKGNDAKPTTGKQAAAAPAGKPLLLHFMIVPDGAKSWMAVGGDEASAIAHVKAAMSGGDGSLATRPGLDKLKNGKMTNGGFFDARGLFGGSPMMAWLTGHDRRLATADAAAKPGTPIVYTLAPSGASPDAPAGTSTLDMTVPASAISETTKAAFTAFSHR